MACSKECSKKTTGQLKKMWDIENITRS